VEEENMIIDLNMIYPGLRKMIADLLKQIEAKGLGADVFCGYRSFAEQNLLYTKGRNSQGKIVELSKVVTYAKGGYSWHNYGLAIDVVFKLKNGNWTWDNSKPWAELGRLGVKLGFEWGGNWGSGKTDRPHFQKIYLPKGITEQNWQAALRKKVLEKKKLSAAWDLI
jgi:peptidoglycan LD-endopeptidase CwlK